MYGRERRDSVTYNRLADAHRFSRPQLAASRTRSASLRFPHPDGNQAVDFLRFPLKNRTSVGKTDRGSAMGGSDGIRTRDLHSDSVAL